MSTTLTHNNDGSSANTLDIADIPGLFGTDLASWLISGKRIKPLGVPTSNLHALDIARDIEAAWRLGVNPIPAIRKNLPAGWVAEIYHPAKAQWVTRLNKVVEDGVFIIYPGLSAIVIGHRISVETYVAGKQADYSDYEAWLEEAYEALGGNPEIVDRAAPFLEYVDGRDPKEAAWEALQLAQAP